MSSSVKHWLDIVVGIITMIATYATPLITFVTAMLGAIWYGIRIYDRLKGNTHANLGHDKLDA